LHNTSNSNQLGRCYVKIMTTMKPLIS